MTTPARCPRRRTRMTHEQLGELSARFDDLKRRINQGTIPYEWAMAELQRVSEGGKSGIIRLPLVTPYLQCISSDEQLVVDACDGTQTIAKAKQLFTAGVDSNFTSWGLDEPGLATPETMATVYEQTHDARFTRLFGTLSSERDQLVWQQEQVIKFVENHRKWLRDEGFATFFLLKQKGQYFVVDIRVPDDGTLYAFVFLFDNDCVWSAEYRHRLVVPQLQTA